MARVLVYERSLDTIQTDHAASCSYTFSLDRVKEEPPDPSENEVAASSTVNQETSSNQSPNNLLNNKENEYLTNRKPKKARRRYDEYRRRRRRVNKNKSVVKNSPNGVSKNRRHFNEIFGNFCEKTSPREKNKNLRSGKNANSTPEKVMARRKKQAPMKISYECPICFLEFDYLTESLEHERLYSRASYQCTKCDAEYIRKSSMQRHLIYCTGHLKSRHKFECNVCNHMFTTKAYLQAHVYHTHYNLFRASSPPKSVSTPSKLSPNASQFGIPEKKIQFDASLTIATDSKSPFRKNLTPTPHSPSKKLRQTTLMEFLQISNKNGVEESSPKKLVDQLETKQTKYKSNEDSGCSTSSELKETNPLVTPQQSGSKSLVVNPSFSGRTTPFVQIHADPELIMKLLDISSTLKEEPLDDVVLCEDTNARQNSPYSLRPKSLADVTYHHFQREKSHRKREHSVVFPDSNKSCDGSPTQRPKKLQFKEESENYHSLIKECSVPLFRCDHLLKPPANTTESHRTTTPVSWTKEADTSVDLINNTDDNRNLENMENRLPKLNRSNDEKVEASTATVSNNESDTRKKCYRCKVCSQRFPLRKSLSKHLNSYHSIYISSICSANYSSRQELLYHYLSQHTIFKRTTCCVCGEKFENRFGLQQHLLLHCIKVLWTQNENAPVDVKMNCNVYKKQHKCHLCKKRFWLSSCLKLHSSVCSTGKKTGESGDRSRQKFMLRNKSRLSNRLIARTTKRKKTEGAVSNMAALSKYRSPNKTDPSSGGTDLGMELCVPQEESRIRDPEIVWLPEAGDFSKSNTKSDLNDLKDTITTSADSRVSVEMKKYECSLCGRSFETVASFHRHEQLYSKPFARQCAICGTEFPTDQFLKAHISATHNRSQRKYSFQCKFCHQGFDKKQRYLTHEAHLHNDQIDTMPVQTWLNPEQVWNVNTMCSICDLMFGTFDQFIMHNVYYYQGHVFTCGFCRETFSGMYMLHHHRKLVHYPAETRKSYPYECDICKEGFSRESHYHAHKLHVHVKESTKGHNSGINLAQESRSLLETDTSATTEPKQIALGIYECTVCQLTFTNEDDLARHETEYSLRGQHKCDQCSKSYPTQEILYQHHSLSHMGRDVPNDYKCRICGEILTTSIAMKCHLKHFHSWVIDHTYNSLPLESTQKSVSSISNQDQCNAKGLHGCGRIELVGNGVSCRTCKTVFDSGIKLKKHLLRYSNIGDHVCAVCHRRFVEKQRLDLHKMKHSRLNVLLSQHHCPICQEGFKALSHVRIHVLHYHGYETFQNILDKRGCFKINRSSNCAEGDKQLGTLPVASNTGYTVIKDPNVCKEKFSSVVADADEGIANSVSCQVCNAKFKNRKSLGKHIARFSNVGEYKCNICHMRFPWESVYTQHCRKHISVTWNTAPYWKYSCYYCSERFRTLRTARFHLLHIHKNNLQQQIINDTAELGNKQVTQEVNGTQDIVLDDKNQNNVNSSEQLNDETSAEPDKLIAENGNDVLIVKEIANTNMAKYVILEGGGSKMNSDTSSRSQKVLDSTKEPAANLRRFHCSICLVRCVDLESYYFHYNSVHGKNAKPLVAGTIPKPMVIIKCIICDGWFINEITLKKHVTKYHPKFAEAIEAGKQHCAESFSGTDFMEIQAL